MKKFLSLLPKPVMIAAVVAVITLIVGAIIVPLLGGARDEAVALGEKLTADISQSQTLLAQTKTDYAFVQEHGARYETLIKGDKLVPHTRRAAVVALQEAATAHGLTALNYSFDAANPTSLKAVTSQSKAGGYTVGVEALDLRVGAALDGALYSFLADVMQSFPGSLVLEKMDASRPGDITPEALAGVSSGKGLVEAEIGFSWRTAQADKTPTEKAK